MNKLDFISLVLAIAFMALLGIIMWLAWINLPLLGALLDIYIISGLFYGIYKNRHAIRLYMKERENERKQEKQGC